MVDWENGDLELASLSVDDFIGKKVEHLYMDEETGDETWHEAEVIDIDVDSKRIDNPDFLVEYTPVTKVSGQFRIWVANVLREKLVYKFQRQFS